MTGLIAFIQALPEVLKLINRLGSLFERILKWSQDQNLDNWISDLEVSVDQLEKAQTAQEKLAAAHALVGSIRKL